MSGFKKLDVLGSMRSALTYDVSPDDSAARGDVIAQRFDNRELSPGGFEKRCTLFGVWALDISKSNYKILSSDIDFCPLY